MVEITTFGSFVIRVNGKVVTASLKRTKKLWRLLNLLIINRDKPLHVSAILESLGNEDDPTVTYKNLHNLVHRLRNLLSGGSSDEHIIYNNNCYLLNTGNGLKIDAHYFEDYCIKSTDAGISPDQRLEFMEQAIEIYNGDYMLDSFCDDIWTPSTASRYKRMFTETAGRLANYYAQTGEYDKLIDVCEKGILLDPLEESFTQFMAKVLLAKNRVTQAILLCKDYILLLHNEMGVRPSHSFCSLYEEIKNSASRLPINNGKTLYTRKEEKPNNKAMPPKPENKLSNAAMLNNAEVFKDICKHETRLGKTYGTTAFIALISIAAKQNAALPTGKLDEIRSFIQESCKLSLRTSDVIAEFSPTQIAVLLSNIDVSLAEIITTRISDKIKSQYQADDITISFDVKPALVS